MTERIKAEALASEAQMWRTRFEEATEEQSNQIASLTAAIAQMQGIVAARAMEPQQQPLTQTQFFDLNGTDNNPGTPMEISPVVNLEDKFSTSEEIISSDMYSQTTREREKVLFTI